MVRVFVSDRRVEVDGQPLRLSPQQFQLYCLLAYERASGRDRFLSVRDIRRLPLWGRASLSSVGKSVHRHVGRMRRAGLSLIESPPRATTELFRLRAASEDVSFNVPLPEVRGYLGLDLAVPECRREAAEQAFAFSWAMVRARLELEKGNFRRVRAALEQAGRLSPQQPRDQIEALLAWSRLLEQEGQPQEALRRAQQALALSMRQAVDYLTQARLHIRLGFLGTMLRQPHLYQQAKAHYAQAHRLLEGSRHPEELAQIATGLGHLARREHDLDTALSHFLAALDLATSEGWTWGIQAGLFNLGLVQAERGDASRDRRARREAYRQARLWLERAVEFTETTGVGRYSSEALGVLSHVLLQEGKASAAADYARLALARAWSTGNKKSQAVAHEALGQVLLAMGKGRDANDTLKASHAIYCRLGFEPDARRVARLIEAPGRQAG